MQRSPSVSVAADCLHRGGVIAYATEAVIGLGADPHQQDAVMRLLALKQRPVNKGVILIAASVEQVQAYIAPTRRDLLERVGTSWPGPNTWVFPASDAVPAWIRGDHTSIALRVSAHPQVVELCQAFGGAIVSTSANRAGEPAVNDLDALHTDIQNGVDLILDGEVSGRDRPSTIRDAETSQLLRN